MKRYRDERRIPSLKKKRKKYFTDKKKKKIQFLFGVTLTAFVVLNGTVVWIQNVKGEEYEKRVLSQQAFESETIPYRRGDIKDCNGTPLATSQKVYNMILDCRLLNEQSEEVIDKTFQTLIECFPDLTESELRGLLEDRKDSSYVKIKRMQKLSYDTIKEFKEISEDSDRNENISGVWFEEEYKRYYPSGSLACDVIGFTYKGSIGNCGIEKSYNDVLNGENGKEYGYMNLDTGQEKVVKDATDGNTVVSTIDSNVQRIVEKHILAFNEAHRDEAREGAGSINTGVIIQNPNTGEIIAEASYPVFDLNNPYDLTVAEITKEDLDALNAELTQKALETAAQNDTEPKAVDVTTEALSAVWRNYCVNDTFEPGSTAKTLTIATGIETGKMTGDEVYICDGYQVVADRKIHCVNRTGHGQETVAQALMYSCNDALMQMAEVIGIDTFAKYQSVFGIGKRTTIDLPAEPNTSNLLYTKENMKPVDLATSSFGQTFNVTMTQMMSAFCSVINGGYYYQPHVVKRIESPSGTTIKNIEPTLMRQTISKETSDIMKEYLKEVVMNGTARSALVPGYTMGGKTGTAEKVENGQRKEDCYVVSFIGCVPADNPELAIYVVIDEPNVEDQAHSSFAQILARDILTEVLPYMNIYPTEEVTDVTLDGTTAVSEDTGGETVEPVYEPETSEGSVIEE